MYVIDIKTLIRLSFSFDPHAPGGRHGLVLRLESWREANNLGQAQAFSRSRLRGTCRPKLATCNDGKSKRRSPPAITTPLSRDFWMNSLIRVRSLPLIRGPL